MIKASSFHLNIALLCFPSVFSHAMSVRHRQRVSLAGIWGGCLRVPWSNMKYIGTTGLVAGSIIGTLRSPNPAVFATAKGAESFLLGSLFWCK